MKIIATSTGWYLAALFLLIGALEYVVIRLDQNTIKQANAEIAKANRTIETQNAMIADLKKHPVRNLLSR